MKPTIEVIVATSGELSINTTGFKGADCEAATRALEEALGAVQTRARKPEYYTHAIARNRQQLGH